MIFFSYMGYCATYAILGLPYFTPSPSKSGYCLNQLGASQLCLLQMLNNMII